MRWLVELIEREPAKRSSALLRGRHLALASPQAAWSASRGPQNTPSRWSWVRCSSTPREGYNRLWYPLDVRIGCEKERPRARGCASVGGTILYELRAGAPQQSGAGFLDPPGGPITRDEPPSHLKRIQRGGAALISMSRWRLRGANAGRRRERVLEERFALMFSCTLGHVLLTSSCRFPHWDRRHPTPVPQAPPMRLIRPLWLAACVMGGAAQFCPSPLPRAV